MFILGIVLCVIKWNWIFIYLNIKCVRRCIGNIVGRKVCDFVVIYGSKMYVYVCVIFFGYLVI